MKRYFVIGRDPQADINIPDETDVVSRHHAVLEVGRDGKYFIIDQSQNGTYVNGIRLSHNEKVPVSRTDSISFAHVADLNWDDIPVDKTTIHIIAGTITAIVLVIACCTGVWYYMKVKSEKQASPVETVVPGQMPGLSPDAGRHEFKPDLVDGNSTDADSQVKKTPKPVVKKAKPVEKTSKPDLKDAIY